jgi:hypothetical protein
MAYDERRPLFRWTSCSRPSPRVQQDLQAHRVEQTKNAAEAARDSSCLTRLAIAVEQVCAPYPCGIEPAAPIPLIRVTTDDERMDRRMLLEKRPAPPPLARVDYSSGSPSLER